MDLKDLIAKMDAIESKGAVEPVMEIAPLIPLAIAGAAGYMAGQGNQDPGPAPTSIVPTHFHKRNFGPIQPLMMTKPGVFWWEGGSSSNNARGAGRGNEIQLWNGPTENRSALNPASVDGVYIDGKPVEFPEGVTWRTYVDPRKPQQDTNKPPDVPQDTKPPTTNTPGQYLNVDPNLRAKFILLVNKVEQKRNSTTNESLGIERALLESFGFVYNEQLNEWSMQDTGDTVRGAYNGVTFGAGDNITAGLKSAFGKDTYAQALAKEKAQTAKAQERSPSMKFNAFGHEFNPSAYDVANLTGALAVPIPGLGLVGGAVAKGGKMALGTGKVAKGVTAVAKGGAQLGTAYIGLSAADKVLAKHNAQQIAKAKGGDPKTALVQLALGMEEKDIDGKLGQNTETWIMTFQDEKELPVTGKLDPATLKALGV
jgi:hypothetical protein